MTMTLPTLFDDIDGPRARLTDPDESHLAADSNSKEHRTAVELAVMLMWRGPMTDEEICRVYLQDKDAFGWPDTHRDSPRKRRADLLNRGLVENSGEVGVTRSGRKAIRWTIKEATK